MVSIASSPLTVGCCSAVGLPRGFLLGDISRPLTEPDLLVGGLVSSPPAEETGERIGDGERFVIPMDAKLVSPARCMLSREPASPLWLCSDWTTSANEMKLSRRTSVVSKLP